MDRHQSPDSQRDPQWSCPLPVESSMIQSSFARSRTHADHIRSPVTESHGEDYGVDGYEYVTPSRERNDIALPHTPHTAPPRLAARSQQHSRKYETEGRVVVQTPHGLALLLSPQSSPVAVLRKATSNKHPVLSVSTTPQRKKFQRWSHCEDNMLRRAVAAEGDGTSIEWKRISQLYFQNSRSPLQCKCRWTKVRQ